MTIAEQILAKLTELDVRVRNVEIMLSRHARDQEALPARVQTLELSAAHRSGERKAEHRGAIVRGGLSGAGASGLVAVAIEAVRMLAT